MYDTQGRNEKETKLKIHGKTAHLRQTALSWLMDIVVWLTYGSPCHASM